MASILEDEPQPIAELRADLPSDLVALVERCLAKRPDGRYASTRDLVHDLRDVIEQIVADTRSNPDGRAPAPRRTNWRLAASVSISVLLLGAPLWISQSGSLAQPALGRNSSRYIAVLPFANVTKDAADQVFADGLAETLASSLTQLERFQRTLRVVPAIEVRAGRVASVKEARQAFGVTLAISGSIQRLPSMLRLTLNLVDANALAQIGSRTIDLATSREVITQDTVISAADGAAGSRARAGRQEGAHGGRHLRAGGV